MTDAGIILQAMLAHHLVRCELVESNLDFGAAAGRANRAPLLSCRSQEDLDGIWRQLPPSADQ